MVDRLNLSTSRHYAIQRLKVFCEELERLKSSTFPYSHSLDALEILEKSVLTHIENLESLDDLSGPLVVNAACSASSALLERYLPYAGFLLRSTNVRNAFEVYGPILQISRQILGPSTKLVLSSEWLFSPHTYIDSEAFKDFVLIGLPASESANPLLLPTAGHELGHTIWNKKIDVQAYQSTLTRSVLAFIRKNWAEYETQFPDLKISSADLAHDIFAQRTWVPACESAFGQVKEIFCDFIGVRIFGESYLNAFAYLVSPGSGQRKSKYPDDRARAKYLIRAIEQYGGTTPKGYEDLFVKPPATREIMQRAADESVENVIGDLLQDADQILNDAGIPNPDAKKISEIHDLYDRLIVPARNSLALSNILNAAWAAYLDSSLWKDMPQIRDSNFVLKELTLKNIEVLEIESRLKGST